MKIPKAATEQRPKKATVLADWNAVAAFACTLPGTELTTHYGKPAVKINGKPIVGFGREKDSFVLHIDESTKNILLAAAPETFWQTPHYEGWNCLLVRFDSPDPGRVVDAVTKSWEWASSLPQRRK